MQMCVLLLLLIGINCSLGLYRSNMKSPLERFRLRAMATLRESCSFSRPVRSTAAW